MENSEKTLYIALNISNASEVHALTSSALESLPDATNVVLFADIVSDDQSKLFQSKTITNLASPQDVLKFVLTTLNILRKNEILISTTTLIDLVVAAVTQSPQVFLAAPQNTENNQVTVSEYSTDLFEKLTVNANKLSDEKVELFLKALGLSTEEINEDGKELIELIQNIVGKKNVLRFITSTVVENQELVGEGNILRSYELNQNNLNVVDLNMYPNCGKYRWTIKIKSIEKEGNIDKIELFSLNDIIANIGICDLNSFDEKKMTMMGHSKNCVKIVYEGKIGHVNNQGRQMINVADPAPNNNYLRLKTTTTIVYDSGTGKLVYEQNGEKVVELVILNDVTFNPYVILQKPYLEVELTI